ncbi:MAG: tubulin-like doman-containing protein [Egibacteraceae bacterium]
MYKAALVLGVGGTGRWALTNLRARLLGSLGASESQHQERLGSVYLLGFDVDQKNTYEFSGHRLRDSEVNLSTPEIGPVIANLREFSDDHPRARYRQFREWISQADAQSYELALLNEYLEDGSGQMRQWGRLAVLLQPEFFTRIRVVMGELAKGGSIEVYVVGSLCGGTGSAAFFDAAMAVHAVRKDVAPGVPIRMIGAFALPAGFTRDVRGEEFAWLEACSFAAMRELDRFQRAPATVRVRTDSDIFALEHRLFDVCYLIEGIREDGRAGGQDLINSPARQGVHAALADLLYSHLHPGSSGRLDPLYPNVVTHLGGPHTYKFSKFGSYSVIVPDNLILRSLALKDAQALIEALLAPAEGEVVRLAAEPNIIFDDEAGKNRKAFNATVFGAVERYLGQRRGERAPRGSETLEWLTPADSNSGLTPPRRPDFLSEFPDITRVRTPYLNREVKERVDSRVTSYLDEVRTFIDRSRPVLLRSFRLYLLAQAVNIASNPTSQGGLARSRVALSKLDTDTRELRQHLQQLFQAQARKRDQAKQAYNDAQEAMGRNRRWDDALQQRGLFEAAERHLEAQVQVEASGPSLKSF